MHRQAHTDHYNPKRLSTFQYKTDEITMQINPKLNLWQLAVGEGPAVSWTNTKGIGTDFKQDNEYHLQSSGVAVKKCQNVRILQIKYVTPTTMEEQGQNASEDPVCPSPVWPCQ